MENKSLTRNKVLYLEQLRVLAIFLVLYCHSGKCLSAYMSADNIVFKLFTILMASVCQSCIPIFFMISGALLLSKTESLNKILLKRFLPMLTITFAVVVIQCVYNMIFYHATITFPDIIEYFYSGGAIREQWFLYAYLGFLLILPFLQKIAAGIEDRNLYWYLLVLMLIISVLSRVFETLSDWKPIGISLPILETVVFYPLMGYFLHCFSHKKLYTVKSKAILSFLGLILLVGNTMINYHSLIYGGKLAYDDFFIGIYAILFFVLLHGKRKVGANNFWFFLGEGVFGVYLFEHQFRAIVSVILKGPIKVLPEYLAGMTELILTLLVGVVIVNFIKKIYRLIISRKNRTHE